MQGLAEGQSRGLVQQHGDWVHPAPVVAVGGSDLARRLATHLLASRSTRLSTAVLHAWASAPREKQAQHSSLTDLSWRAAY